MQKKNRRKLQLHRESIRGLDLGSVAGGATGTVCSVATVCTGNVRCTVLNCSLVVTGCTFACPA
jgi:hypothetical protein